MLLMKTLQDLQDEIQALLTTLSSTYTARLEEITSFLSKNNFININDLDSQFPTSLNITEIARQLYHLNLLLKGQLAIKNALDLTFLETRNVNANLFEELLNDTKVVTHLSEKGEQRAILAKQLNEEQDNKKKTVIANTRDGIFDEIQLLSKEQRLLCSYFEYSKMVTLFHDQLESLPTLISTLQSSINKAEANNQRVERPKVIESSWDNDFEEGSIDTRSRTPELLTSEDLSDDEKDWDTEINFNEEAPSAAASQPDSRKDVDLDPRDLELTARPLTIGHKRDLESKKEKESSEKAAKHESADKSKSPRSS